MPFERISSSVDPGTVFSAALQIASGAPPLGPSPDNGCPLVLASVLKSLAGSHPKPSETSVLVGIMSTFMTLLLPRLFLRHPLFISTDEFSVPAISAATIAASLLYKPPQWRPVPCAQKEVNIASKAK